MPLLFESFSRAARSVFAPGMFVVFFQSVALTLFVLMGFIFLGTIATGAFLSAFDITLGAWRTAGVGLLSSLMAWFLFPGIMPLIVNFFDVKIMRLIEQHDYPAAPAPQEPPLMPELWHDVRFTLGAIALNLLVLPLYFVPLLNIFVFYSLNGFLLGREFFNVAARRHVGIAAAEALRKQHSRIITLGGAALVFCATVPFINLLAPFWGIAVMTHLFHGLRGTPQSRITPPAILM